MLWDLRREERKHSVARCGGEGGRNAKTTQGGALSEMDEQRENREHL